MWRTLSTTLIEHLLRTTKQLHSAVVRLYFGVYFVMYVDLFFAKFLN